MPFRVKVLTIDRGTDADMKRRAANFVGHLRYWLNHKHALGLFVVSRVRSDDPWGGWEVFVEYHGEASSVQMKGKWKAKRRRQRPAPLTT